MKRMFVGFMLLAVSMVCTVKSFAQNLTVADLTGKWKLAKVEVIQKQGDAELSRQAYLPADYTGKIYFEQVRCSPSGRTIYDGKKRDDGLRNGGGLQVDSHNGHSYVTFNGEAMGAYYEFEWVKKSVEFSLTEEQLLSQQTGEKKIVKLYYSKF